MAEVTTKTTVVATKSSMQTPVIVSVLSGVGMLGGLFYAFKSKRKFWGYIGFAVLGSISGSIVGGIISQVVPKKKDAVQTTVVKDIPAPATK